MLRSTRSRVLLAAAALGLILAPSAAVAACQPSFSPAPPISRGERETRPTPTVVTPPPATSTAPVIPRGDRPLADPPVVVTPAPSCN